jgi:hypothetical protein
MVKYEQQIRSDPGKDRPDKEKSGNGGKKIQAKSSTIWTRSLYAETVVY